MSRLSLLLVLSILAYPLNAAGHAEEPNSQNVFSTDDTGGWVLRANVGIVQSSNQSELICEEAFLGGDGWILGALGPTEWVTFGETAVMRTDDGCYFETVHELDRRPSDATVHVSSGGAAFVMNGIGAGSGLYVSTDRGMTFSLIQGFDPDSEQTTGVRYLDQDTVLVSGYSRTDNGSGLLWTVDVATGAATPVTPPLDVTYPYVLAASGGQVLMLARRGDQIVFWGPTDNLEQNSIVADTWPTWATLTDDGQTALISGLASGKGVTVGARGANDVVSWETFAPETTASCVEPIGEDLFICGLGRFDEFDVLKIDSTGAIDGVLDFRKFTGVRSDCPADSEVGTVCPLVWKELAPYFGIEIEGDAGGDSGAFEMDSDMGSAPDGGAAPASDVGGGGCCATSRAETQNHALLIFALLCLVGRRRALTQKLRRCY